MDMPAVRRHLLPALVVLAGVAFAPPAGAAADGTAPAFAVPWVKSTASVSTAVEVLNHGVDAVDLAVELVDARPGGGTTRCSLPPTASPLQPRHQVDLDIDRNCPGLGMSGVAFDGALRVRASAVGGRSPARIAAMARWIVVDAGGRREQEFEVPALPLGALPGIDRVQRVDALAHDDTGAPAVQTDCHFAAAPADDPSAREVDVRLERNGMRLGSPITLVLSPGSVENVPDVFNRMRAGGGAFDDVQLVVTAAAQPDLGLAVACSVLRQRRSGGLMSPAITMHGGLPLDGASLVRRHEAAVSEVAPGKPLVVTGKENVLHHVFLRHQDRLTCSVRPTDPATSADALRLSAVPPDRSRTLGGMRPDLVLEDTGTRAGTAAGLGGAWALIVEQTVPDPSLGIAYRLACSAGNGVSPPLRVAVSRSPLPRP
jgi:hypothetical protein